MSAPVERLASSLKNVSGPPLPKNPAEPANLQDSYLYFLVLCDGGYSEDYFFHFFGRQGGAAHNLLDWNNPDSWKKYYSLDQTSFIFAENILGQQFFFDVRGNRRVVKMLDNETGKTSLCANTFEDFIEGEVFSNEFNADLRTLAKRFFHETKAVTKPFTHITCKKPVILGGTTSDLDNLEISDSLGSLTFTGQVLSQARALPSGTQIDRVRGK